MDEDEEGNEENTATAKEERDEGVEGSRGDSAGPDETEAARDDRPLLGRGIGRGVPADPAPAPEGSEES